MSAPSSTATAVEARHQYRRLPLFDAGGRLRAGRGTARHPRSRSRPRPRRASASSSRTPSSCCCPGRRPRRSIAAPRRFVSLPVEIHLGPEQVLYKFEEARLSTLGPVASLQLTRLPLSRLEIIEKRVFDLVVRGRRASSRLTPFLILVALLIKLDSPGPVFFLQRRYGFNQQQFRIIKFRTMRTLDDGAVIRRRGRTIRASPAIGRWLRRWNIDELPQLFNVLKGDMSLVGPRPHALSHNREYEQRSRSTRAGTT